MQRARVSHPSLERAQLNWHGKVEFDPVQIGLPALTAQLDIGAIFIPSLARAARTEIARVSSRDAALALAPSATLQLPGDTNEGFAFFAGIARRLPAYRLTLSEDPGEITATIGEFLVGARHRAN